MLQSDDHVNTFLVSSGRSLHSVLPESSSSLLFIIAYVLVIMFHINWKLLNYYELEAHCQEILAVRAV